MAKPARLCMCLLIIGLRWERKATSQSHACCIWIRRLITGAEPKFPAAVLVKEMSGHATLGYFLLPPPRTATGLRVRIFLAIGALGVGNCLFPSSPPYRYCAIEVAEVV